MQWRLLVVRGRLRVHALSSRNSVAHRSYPLRHVEAEILARHAAFPEILEATGGGVLCEPDDAASLASALEGVLTDEARAAEFATRGRSAVLERFHSERMAKELLEVCALATSDR